MSDTPIMFCDIKWLLCRKEDGELEAKQNKELFRTRARFFKERRDKEEKQKQQKEWRAQENKVR